MNEDFNYQDERFADLQLLRYRLNGFERLTLKQKTLVYYLSQATLYGRDITFDQFGKYNLRIRKMLEVIYTDMTVPHDTDEFKALEIYLKRIWFSSGIYHHYGCEKFKPGFTPDYLNKVLRQVDARQLPLNEGETISQMCDELFPIIFDETVMPKRVNKADGEDFRNSRTNIRIRLRRSDSIQHLSKKTARSSRRFGLPTANTRMPSDISSFGWKKLQKWLKTRNRKGL